MQWEGKTGTGGGFFGVGPKTSVSENYPGRQRKINRGRSGGKKALSKGTSANKFRFVLGDPPFNLSGQLNKIRKRNKYCSAIIFEKFGDRGGGAAR